MKIDRLVDGVAQIWWRQHEQLKKDDDQLKEEEVHGLELMKSLQNYDILHQLMFATILLHWNLHLFLLVSSCFILLSSCFY